MNGFGQANGEQSTLWNGTAGRAWVETQALLDDVFQPFEDLLAEAIVAKRPARVLDVGCGTGATTLAAARVIGSSGHCLGIDISEPMLALARARAAGERARAAFVRADAQTHALAPASFDMIVSRFGVMFFDDAVAAFSNLRRAAADDAELRVLAWRSAEENPFMTTAERAAAPLLPASPPRAADAPGQFAFAERARIECILEESGWLGVDVQPIDVPCRFPARELVRWFTQMGPIGRVLQGSDARTRARLVEAVRPAYDRYFHGDEVRFDAACWLVVARAGGIAGSIA